MPDDDETRPTLVRSELSRRRIERNDSRRAEALSLLLAGLTHDQIADRLEVSRTDVGSILSRALADRPVTGVDEMRMIENARLDRAQAAIWTKVLEGDPKAVQSFLSISQRRSRLNGMDAPMQIEMSAHVRIEMQQALDELQEIVLGEAFEVRDDDDPGSTAL